MFTVFLVIQVLITLAMVVMILLQRSESDGLSGLGGGGGAGSIMTGRAAASFMTRTTAILAAAFMINSLWLAILVANDRGDSKSLVEQITAEDPLSPLQKVAPADEAPAKTETVPVAGEPEAAKPADATVPADAAPEAAKPETAAPAEPAAETPETPVNVPTPD